MRVLGQMALTVLATLALLAASAPVLAVILLGAPALAGVAGDPATVRAGMASLRAASLALVVGWPAGVSAALGIWSAGRAPRRIVLGSAWMALLAALALSAYGPDAAPTGLSALLPPTAAAAGLALLILTGALNGLDPLLLRTGAASGAAPMRAWLAVLASLRPALGLSAATSLSLGLAFCVGVPNRINLAGLLRQAMRQADVQTAPTALLLALASLAPLVLAGSLLGAGRAFRRS